MSSDTVKKKSGSKQEQSWWDKVFGTGGLVGLIAVLVPLASFLHATHTWPFSDKPSSSGATPGTQASTVQPRPSSSVTAHATKPSAMSQSAAQSAVDTALLKQTDLASGSLASAFGDMQGIPTLSGSDFQCQPSGQPPKLATVQSWFGTNGITDSQAVQDNNTNYATADERINAYNNNDTSTLAQYLDRYQAARNNCTDSFNGLTVIYQVMSGAPSLCDQSFVTTGTISGNPIADYGYEAFIRCGNLYAYVAIIIGSTSNISQSAVYGLFETAANKLRDANNS